MNLLDDLVSNKSIFLNYMKEKYEVHYKSNIFLRDLLYAIKSFYEKKGKKVKYAEAEKLAFEFCNVLINNDELIPTSKNTWKVNFSLDSTVK